MNKRQSYTADKITVLYCRLSRDDELQGDCNNQTENDMTPFITFSMNSTLKIQVGRYEPFLRLKVNPASH